VAAGGACHVFCVITLAKAAGLIRLVTTMKPAAKEQKQMDYVIQHLMTAAEWLVNATVVPHPVASTLALAAVNAYIWVASAVRLATISNRKEKK
jgi:hypothetical protein